MNIIENKIYTTKSAYYYSIGLPTNKIKNIWFVFHGYGELAKDFIKNFEILKKDENLIIAPQALNKFYLRGFSGKIGSTWMTKENRESEIEDYVNLIENIYNEISKKIELSKIKMNVLGFSQGGHTASRWLGKNPHPINRLILWGSSLPRDINYNFRPSYWNDLNIKLVIGNEDRFITKEKLDEELIFLKSQKINYELISYEGIHKIDEKILKNISEQLK